MKRGNIKYISAIWWLAPLLIGFLLATFVFLADPSAMSLWRLRSLAANGVVVCLLGHCVAVIVLLVRRRWKSGLIALVILPLFFIFAFLVASMIGPTIDAVTEKVSAATAVPQSEIKCLGGWLRREAVIVFELRSLRQKIEQTAQAILDARARYPESSLADLYDPITMPPDLRAAHEANDRAVLAAYGLAPDTPEPEIVAHLFKLYAEKVSRSR